MDVSLIAPPPAAAASRALICCCSLSPANQQRTISCSLVCGWFLETCATSLFFVFKQLLLMILWPLVNSDSHVPAVCPSDLKLKCLNVELQLCKLNFSVFQHFFCSSLSMCFAAFEDLNFVFRWFIELGKSWGLWLSLIISSIFLFFSSIWFLNQFLFLLSYFGEGLSLF